MTASASRATKRDEFFRLRRLWSAALLGASALLAWRASGQSLALPATCVLPETATATFWFPTSRKVGGQTGTCSTWTARTGSPGSLVRRLAAVSRRTTQARFSPRKDPQRGYERGSRWPLILVALSGASPAKTIHCVSLVIAMAVSL